MRITCEQKELLDSLICERLSSNGKNIYLVSGFSNTKNPNLEDTLKGEAYEEDENGDVAYYLIKNADGKILFYFSIKCGMLYDEAFEIEQLRRLNELYCHLVELEKDSASSDEDKRLIGKILEGVRTRKGLKKNDLLKINNLKANQILEDLKKESERKLRQVGRTFAGVEIVHFCVNENNRDTWAEFGFKQKIGAVIFWHFIVPKIFELKKIIGCEYLFLFAADSTPDKILINYYKANLGFEESNKHGTAMPLYDYACTFLYQELKDIAKKQRQFYEEFNPNEEQI